MKRQWTLIVLAALIFPFTSTASAAEPFATTKGSTVRLESSEVTIKGTSTLHEWEMTGATINGTIDTDPEAWREAGDKSAKLSVTIPVTSIRSESTKMDALMQKALKSKANPDIKYEMDTAALTKITGDSFIVRTTGKLTIAGATHDMTMDVTATRINDKRYVLTGQAPIKMPDYGVKPPSAMLGTIRTGPDVTIAFRWVVGRS